MHKEYWENRMMSALTLITIGVVFLLNTTGVISWSIWLNILRFWPLFLITAGISIILGFSRLTKFIASLISYLLFLSVIAFSAFATNTTLFDFGNGQEITSTYQVSGEEYKNVKSRDFIINVDTGKLTVSDTNSPSLFEAKSIFYRKSDEPKIEKQLNNTNLKLSFSTDHNNYNLGFNAMSPRYNISLGQNEIATNLQINIGAGSSDINIENTRINEFSANTGAGDIKVNFTSVPQQITAKVGAGKMDIYLPKNSAVIVNYKVGLGDVNVNNEKVSVMGSGTYKTPAGSESNDPTTVNAEVGMGELNINFN